MVDFMANIYGVKPAVIGHRGSGKSSVVGHTFPLENTAASCRKAFEDGADGVEIDIQPTSDGQIVVCHDVRGSDEQLIRESRAADLTAHSIENLDTLAEAVPLGRAFNIEVKTGYDDAAESSDHTIVPLIATWLAQGHAEGRHIVLSSFDPDVVRTLSLLSTPVALITAPVEVRDRTPMPLERAINWASELGAVALHAHTAQFSIAYQTQLRREIDSVHAAGLSLAIWCPEPADAATFAGAGVDAVCVNHVPETVALIRP